MTNGRGKIQHNMQGVFVFVLLGLFALMSTLMVLLGAQMYRGTVDRSADNNDFRVLSAYVRSMVRAEDSAASVEVSELGGVRALALKEIIDDEEYVTWIYACDGMLYEQFTDLGDAFDPLDGTEICAVDSFEPEVKDGLVTARMTDADGETCTVQVALRCAE